VYSVSTHHMYKQVLSAQYILPHKADVRWAAEHRKYSTSPRPLSHLPRLRDDLPVRRVVRAPARYRTQAGRGKNGAAGVGTGQARCARGGPAASLPVRAPLEARPARAAVPPREARRKGTGLDARSGRPARTTPPPENARAC